MIFTRESYKKLITDQYNADEQYGGGYEGAVCYEIIFHEDRLLDVNFYLLGKDTGYGEINGIPYSYEDGFYATVYGTYEETLAELKRDIDEYISSNADLAEGVRNTTLTWSQIEEGRYE